MAWRLFRTNRRGNRRDETHSPATASDLDGEALPFGTCGFSVVDIETTGLFVGRHDRILEIAIIQLEPTGQIVDEYVTLVNPERDVGPTHIHGIAAREIIHAPHFSDIAGDIVGRLAGKVLAAHNSPFDVTFLEAEFDRIGCGAPPMAAVCTLTLAHTLLPQLPSYRLIAVCEYLGIPLPIPHSALDDARATAALLTTLLTEAEKNGLQTLAALGCSLTPPPVDAWPALPTTGLTQTRQAAATSVEPPHLARLIERLATAPVHHDPETAQYVDLLDRVLEDRRVTSNEAEALLATATRWGLSGQQVSAVHDAYLEAMAVEAAEDQMITEAERRDLYRVAELLGYDSIYLDWLMSRALVATEKGLSTEHSAISRLTSSLAGLSVCFTGESRCALGGQPILREQAEQFAFRAGLVVRNSVTKGLDLLVVADPYSLSGKAKKARDYGTRIVAEEVFWRMLGINVD